MPDRDSSSEALSLGRVSVLLPLPLAGAYDYRTPDGVALAPGDFVRVPLGRRTLAGVVWGRDSGEVAEAKLKAVAERLPAPPLRPELRRFVDWVAQYNLAPQGAVLKMAMSVPAALHPPSAIPAYVLSQAGARALAAEAESLTKARRRVLEALAGGPAATSADLARRASCGASVVKGLAKLGLLAGVDLPPFLPPQPDWKLPGPALSAAQALAAKDLSAKAERGGFSVTLLDGVTGSGKTEVYFDAISAALAAGKQALVLLPEISLSAQLLARFAKRFGSAPAEWHSDLGHAARRATWRQVAEGKARVVVGARSALFLPFRELGLIVVDEEHETSFKQEEGVIYHARDMAVVRASLAGIPIVLVSATPSLETTVNVEQGRYARLHLPARHGTAQLPEIRMVDLRRDKPERQRFLSPPLVRALEDTLKAGEQAMLFLNRRGYAPLTLCRECGFRLQCPNCTAWLIEHRLHGRLLCHHCGYTAPPPPQCPNPECQAVGSFAPCGPGVERLAEEVALRFPDARLQVMASDTLAGPRAMEELLER